MRLAGPVLACVLEKCCQGGGQGRTERTPGGLPSLPPACPTPCRLVFRSQWTTRPGVSIRSKPCQESAPCQVQFFKVPLQGHSVCLIGLLIKSLMFLSLL